MKKILCIILIFVVVGIILFWNNSSTTVDKSVQVKIDSIYIFQDSIDKQIDTVNVVIEKNHIQYEKDRNTIINNTTNEDYMFFLEYIRSNKSRFDSLYNF